jgi:DNA polymerase-3 subunit epsilon
MKLYFDCETSGLVHRDLPAEHPHQPHLVQLGVVLATDAGSEVSSAELVVRPTGWTIPEGASRVHGITSGIAAEIGVPLATVLSVFLQLRANASELVAFNMDFDDLVMRAAIARSGRTPSNAGPSKLTCCMRDAAEIMKLPPTDRMRAAGFEKYKPPNLKEAHQHFLGEGFEGAHSALADARACMRVHLAMMKLATEVPY